MGLAHLKENDVFIVRSVQASSSALVPCEQVNVRVTKLRDTLLRFHAHDLLACRADGRWGIVGFAYLSERS